MPLKYIKARSIRVLFILMIAISAGGCASKQPEQSVGSISLEPEVQVPLQKRFYLEEQKVNTLEQEITLEANRDYTESNSPDVVTRNYIPFTWDVERNNTSNLSSSSNHISNDHFYLFMIYPSSEPRDEVVIVSLDIRDCVARGLMHNVSENKFARNVEIALESKDGSHSVSWTWPLTVMPGEYTPFEILIDWDYSYLDPIVGGPHMEPGQRLASRRLTGNIISSVKADFTTEVDMSRAFALDWDQSPLLERYGELQQLIIYDERLFALDEWDSWNEQARAYQLVSEDDFEYSFPKSLMLSDEMNAIASKFTILELSDLHYIPDVIFSGIYDEDSDRRVDDVKIYQAITKGVSVLDVRELIPFVVEYEKSNAELQFLHFIPKDDFITTSSNAFESRFVILSVPEIYPEINEGIYSSSVSYGSDSAIWVGQPNKLSQSETDDMLEEAEDGILSIQDGTSGQHCNRIGGLTKEEVRYGSSPSVSDITLGYHGLFREFESSQEPIHSVEIDFATVSAQDGFVRGLVHNLSGTLFAREITVEATRMSVPEITGKWHWPLTLQPGERAPFEISLGDWNGSIPISELDLQVNSDFLQQVDISRSFQARGYNHGTVYAENSPVQLGTIFQSKNHFLDITSDGAFFWPHQYISLNEYIDRYPAQYQDKLISPFHFVDLHVQLEIPDSHPSLGSQIISQTIDSLCSYAAIINQDGRVSDVKKLVPFITFNLEKAGQEDCLVVDSNPAPNLTNPGSFRLLFTIPYSEERRPDLRNSYQVWIGGSDQSVG